jgi:hypothetical protein
MCVMRRALILLLASGCGGGSTGRDAGARDLAFAVPDLAIADLAEPADLSLPPDIRQPLAKGKCRGDGDCDPMRAERCLPPGAHPGCGACRKIPDPCFADADCKAMGASFICDPAQCACGGESECQMGCTKNGDCAFYQYCGPTSRCENAGCKKDADCPANFTCAQRCTRKACTSDGDCRDWCVLGLCQEMPGSCMPPVP